MRLALVLVAACGETAAAPVAPPAPRVVAPADAAAVTDDEKLAAIQKAMNELAPTAQACWATVAAVRFDVEGEMTALIAIARSGLPDRAAPPKGGAESIDPTAVTITRDTTHNAKLAACMTEVLAAYPWAPPLRGETISLPFKFRMPDGQSVIDRRLVPWNGQGKISVAVYADEDNTGNAAASLLGLRIADGGATGLRSTDRAELWYFESTAEVRPAVGKPFAVAAGDLVYVPANGVRDIAAIQGQVAAMIAVVPGGHEGAARAGALPTPEVHGWDKPPPEPRKLAAGKPLAHAWGKVAIAAEPSVTQVKTFAASVIELDAGAVIPEHTHEGSELLYVLAGTGTLTVAGVALAVTATSVVQIPAGAKHAFTAATAVRAIQLYAPAGPEQRFKQ